MPPARPCAIALPPTAGRSAAETSVPLPDLQAAEPTKRPEGQGWQQLNNNKSPGWRRQCAAWQQPAPPPPARRQHPPTPPQLPPNATPIATGRSPQIRLFSRCATGPEHCPLGNAISEMAAALIRTPSRSSDL